MPMHVLACDARRAVLTAGDEGAGLRARVMGELREKHAVADPEAFVNMLVPRVPTRA